jgi:hypothetical protein
LDKALQKYEKRKISRKMVEGKPKKRTFAPKILNSYSYGKAKH